MNLFQNIRSRHDDFVNGCFIVDFWVVFRPVCKVFPTTPQKIVNLKVLGRLRKIGNQTVTLDSELLLTDFERLSSLLVESLLEDFVSILVGDCSE